MKIVASTTRIPLKDWVRVVPVVQAALNAGYREHLEVSPSNLIFGRKLLSVLSDVVAPGTDEWQVDSLVPTACK